MCEGKRFGSGAEHADRQRSPQASCQVGRDFVELHRSWTSLCFLFLLFKGGSPYYIPQGLSQLLLAETLTCKGTVNYLEKYLEHSEHNVNLVKYD